jgi:rod shape determining protein RodA
MAHAQREIFVTDFALRMWNWRNAVRFDWVLLLLVAMLAGVGLVNIYSASRSGDPSIFYNHLAGVCLGFGLLFVLACLDYRVLVSLSPFMYIGGVMLLAVVLWFGHEVKGSERWLQVGFIRIQPSEPTKFAVVCFLAWYLSRLGGHLRKAFVFFPSWVFAALPAVLILKQPNLGTAASLFPITAAMMWAAGARKRHFMVLGFLLLAAIPVLWWEMRTFDPNAPASPKLEEDSGKKSRGFLKDYQKRRIYTFFHPEYDIRGAGWHVYQSKIAVGSGGPWGKGWLQSTQTRLNYLPEHHTDFIFSLLAEEWGFAGVCAVLGLFLIFLLRGLYVAQSSVDVEGRLLCVGIVSMFAFHILINIAITVGAAPVTGLPLPFLSYGRSFYLTNMACIGVMMSVAVRSRTYVP